MQIISFMAQKGGVGKTTLTFQFAKFLQSKNQPVLLIDIDDQKTLTGLFENNDFQFDNTYTVSSILNNPKIPFKAISVQNNIDIIPSHSALADTLEDLANKNGKYMRLFRWFIYNYNILKNKYDFVLLDTPTGWNIAVKNAILVSDKIISPMDPGFGGYQNLDKFKDALKALSTDDDLADPRTGESYISAKLYFLPNRIKYNTALSKSFVSTLNKDPQVFDMIHEKELLNRSEMAREGAREYARKHKQETQQKKFLDHLDNTFNKIGTLA